MRGLFKKSLLLIASSTLSFSLTIGLFLTTEPNFSNLVAVAEESVEQGPTIATTKALSFTDVNEENYHYVPILTLAEEGIINGYEDGTFRPYDTINRAEALKIIMEAFAEPTDSTSTIENTYEDLEKRPFQDTPLNSWYLKYITEGLAKGVVDGYEDGTFRPWESLNLAEALKIIETSLPNYIPNTPEEDPFADVTLADWHTEYFQYAKNREMINISDSNEVFPGQEMTRGYLAEIIYKIKYFWKSYHFGKATYYGAAVQGNGTASGKTFDMYEMTAAHKTLPFGTIVKVTNLANGKAVEVEITDRGPYGPGRVIDLTTAAFEKISELHRGVINVQYEIVEEPTQ